MTLTHKDYFELKAREKKQIQEKLSALPLFAYKYILDVSWLFKLFKVMDGYISVEKVKANDKTKP